MADNDDVSICASKCVSKISPFNFPVKRKTTYNTLLVPVLVAYYGLQPPTSNSTLLNKGPKTCSCHSLVVAEGSLSSTGTVEFAPANTFSASSLAWDLGHVIIF